ncbi:hypothetical protein PRIPAC_78511 [Pristionchus pacificus]|uniref:Uncharacterized protein n=1 Tax=Pristionchus pacificus TaxID=54126 RepID=A0A2A6BEC0_PRIPA|nr:hypothetical protein PRIPAC_78511 [Pristionchus pacificus]|eukprot:PDM64250.1 hypothetical protein PRIPAC_54494 [Pristionchus pacificus]
MDVWLFIAAFLPLLLASSLFIISLLLLIGVHKDHRLRELYLVFSAKFIVDGFTSLLVISVAGLIFSEQWNNPAVPLISTMTFLSQNTLLLCESFDWWTATFKPVHFHHASQMKRTIPYAIGCGTVVISFFVLLALQIQIGFPMAWVGEEIITTLSFIIVLLALIVMLHILKNNPESSYSQQITMHATACAILSLAPMAVVTIFSWLYSQNIVRADQLLYTRQAIRSFLSSSSRFSPFSKFPLTTQRYSDFDWSFVTTSLLLP